MNNVVEQIRSELEPYHVEGFTAMCCPAPHIQQVEQLIAEIDRLTALCEEKGREPILPKPRKQREIMDEFGCVPIDCAELAQLRSDLSQARDEVAKAEAELQRVPLLAHESMKAYLTRAEAAEQREKGLREALEKIAKSYKPFNMSIISLQGKIAFDALEKAALAAAKGGNDEGRPSKI